MDNVTRLQYLKIMGIDIWGFQNQVQKDKIMSVDSWPVLQKVVADCQKCSLCNTRTQTVFGTGKITADWMIIGEAPGYHEDLEGKPFSSQAELLLSEMMRAIGLKKEAVYITNIIKCRTPSDREPTVEEIGNCHNYLQQQIALIKPKIILTVGHIAAQTLLKTNAPLADLRGKLHKINNINLVITYNPAYLLRHTSEKREAWHDLQFAIKQDHKRQ